MHSDAVSDHTAPYTYSLTWYCTLSIAPPCIHGNVHLAGGETSYEGRVEICLSGSWVSVCNIWYPYNHWNVNESTVVCRQLTGEQNPRKM